MHNLIKLTEGIIMKKIVSFILGSILALNLSVSVANAAAKEVRIAFFLEWASPNQEDKVKGILKKLWVFQLNGQTLQQVVK